VTAPAPDAPRATSLERRLLAGLALIAGVATTLVIALFAVTVHARERAELRRNVDTSVDEIAHLVESALWDLDLERAERLGEAFAQDPRVVRLVIRETTSGAARVVTHAAAGDTVMRARVVRHDGTPIGEVRLTFTAAPYAERAWQQVRVALWVGVIALALMLLAVRLLLRRLLRRPLAELSDVVQAYERGERPVVGPAMRPAMSYAEFRPFAALVDAMATRIMAQLRDLHVANAQLARSRNMLAQVMNSVPQAIFWKDRDGTYLGGNMVFARANGLASPDAVAGLTDADLPWTDDVRERRRALDGLVLGDAQPRHHVVEQLATADGARWIDTTKVPLADDAGRVFGILGVVEDVTDRVAAEEALRHAQKLEAVGQLAGGIAHDFNNILGAMLMELQLLEAEHPIAPTMARGFGDLRTSIDRAANLTRQLLTFSRRHAMRVGTHDLNTVVDHLLRMLTRIIDERVVVTFRAADDPVPFRGDAGMIEQVVTNLCVNARDAMPDGGTLTIVTSLVTRDGTDAAHPAARPGRFACVEVRDTGVGMSAEVQQRIFEPFFTTKDVGKGTGLGLATTHGIVAQHDGWIEVASALRRGTTFRVLLPAVDAPPPLAPARAAESTARGAGETVLVVEDERLLRGMVSRTLRRLGYRVLEAANGVEARRLWAAEGPSVDLLLTDMVMPERISGIDLARELRATKPSLPVVVMSGYSAELTDGEADDVLFLGKPFTIGVLSEAVARGLGRR